MELLTLGKIINTHGLDGTLVCFSTTDFANERYQEGNNLFIHNPYNKENISVTVVSYRKYKGMDYVKFEEIKNIDEAVKLKGFEICIEKEKASIPKDYFYYHDLENCDLIDENNKHIGKVLRVEEFPAQITLRCKTDDGKKFMIPFIKDVFILDVDLDSKLIKINFMEGLVWKR